MVIKDALAAAIRKAPSVPRSTSYVRLMPAPRMAGRPTGPRHAPDPSPLRARRRAIHSAYPPRGVTPLIKAVTSVTRKGASGGTHDPKDRTRCMVPIRQVSITPITRVPIPRPLMQTSTVTRSACTYPLNLPALRGTSIPRIGATTKGKMLTPPCRARTARCVVFEMPRTTRAGAITEVPNTKPTRINRQLTHPFQPPRAAPMRVTIIHFTHRNHPRNTHRHAFRTSQSSMLLLI